MFKVNNNLCNLWCGEKCLSFKLKKNLSTFLVTVLLYGGLNQIICVLRCYELSFFWSCFWYFNLQLQHAFIIASWYVEVESLNIFSFQHNLLKRCSTDEGKCLLVKREWFDCLCIQFISLFVFCLFFFEWTLRRICKVKSSIQIIHIF